MNKLNVKIQALVFVLTMSFLLYSCSEKSNTSNSSTYKGYKGSYNTDEKTHVQNEQQDVHNQQQVVPYDVKNERDNAIQEDNYTKNYEKKENSVAPNLNAVDVIYGETDYYNSIGYAQPSIVNNSNSMNKRSYTKAEGMGMSHNYEPAPIQHNTEEYDVVKHNTFLATTENPLSTFSIDVDNASYTNSRRIINSGSLPPKDAVRIEEFINYFSYNYKQPSDEHPFSINTEIGAAPWNTKHKLVHIGLQGKQYPFHEIEPFNLVFLIDVSGSMSSSEKLPLLKKSYHLLVNKMRPQDRIAIVVYAGAAGVVLPSTSGNDKQKIRDAIENLQSGGSTAGGEGIKLAYQIAQDNFKENGVNRIILATDGDFNIGASSNGEMTRLIEEKRDAGVFLTVLGFGMGNYKDSKMETIADNGNGNYFYIDNIQESNKVLVDELGSTLYTIAKDVKLQVEFNPNKVQAYRLIGYENRMLKKEDFNDDKKDAGELGAGHTVTALYEIIPVGVKSDFTKSVDALKYQIPAKTKETETDFGNELLTVKFRYKKPNETKSNLMVHTLKDSKEINNSENFNFSAAVAGFGMLLTNSEFKQNLDYGMVLNLAYAGKGNDYNGYRAEFIKLVKTAEMLGGLAQK